MNTNVEIRLLEMTRKDRKVCLTDLACHLGMDQSNLVTNITKLHEDNIIQFNQGMLEVTSQQRLLLATYLIRRGSDPQRISRFLGWQEFEDFTEESLRDNGFRTIKHLVFRTQSGRREIDLIAWNDLFLLSIDCKHWLRGLSYTKLVDVVAAQIERTQAIAQKPDLLTKRGVVDVHKRLMTPVILSLVEPQPQILNGVPVVSILKLISFLHEFSPFDARFRIIKPRSNQTLL